MDGRWVEVARLAFKGERFRDHALDVDALAELGRFQAMVSDTAKLLWRAANPKRERLPKGFEERTRLWLRRVEAGSAQAPLETYLERTDPPELFDPNPSEATEAISLVNEVLRAVEEDGPLPDRCPQSLVSGYARFGESLEHGETIEVIASGTQPARVTVRSRCRLAAFAEGTHEGPVDVTGEVLEADVRQGRFQLWLDEKTGPTVSFSPSQESEVTGALRDHKTLRLQVIGRGEFSSLGELLRVTEVEELRPRRVGEATYDAAARPIEDILEELASEIPEEDWQKLPPDLTDNLDHYVYGTPKR